MKLRINANAIILNNEGKILIVKLKKGPYKEGFSIPGGGIEPGELGIDTIKREIKEETGIEVNEIIPYGFCELMQKISDNQRVVLLYTGKGEGKPIETEEAISYWMNIEEVLDKAIPFTKESIKIWKNKDFYFCLKE